MEKIDRPELQFNSFAEDYSRTRVLIKELLAIPTLLHLIGDIENQLVLDIACGDGYLTRILSRKGASLTGVDSAEEMIKIAVEKERVEDLNIKYICREISKMGEINFFDLITASALLHYCPDKDRLKKMCVAIYNNLKDGGSFFATNHNPDYPFCSIKKYRTIIEDKGPLNEGDMIHASIINDDGKKILPLFFYFWEKKTYEEAFIEAGFKNVKWHKLDVSPEGIDEKGIEFWNDFLAKPFITIIEANT